MEKQGKIKVEQNQHYNITLTGGQIATVMQHLEAGQFKTVYTIVSSIEAQLKAATATGQKDEFIGAEAGA